MASNSDVKHPGFGKPILILTKLLLDKTNKSTVYCDDHVENEKYDHPAISNEISIIGNVFAKDTQDIDGWSYLGKEYVDSIGYAMHNIIHENGAFEKDDQEHLKEKQTELFKMVQSNIESQDVKQKLLNTWSQYSNDLINSAIMVGKNANKSTIKKQFEKTIDSSLNFAQQLNKTHIDSKVLHLHDAYIAKSMNDLQLFNNQPFIDAGFTKNLKKFGSKVKRGFKSGSKSAFRKVSRRTLFKTVNKFHLLTNGTRQYRKDAIYIPQKPSIVKENKYLLLAKELYKYKFNIDNNTGDNNEYNAHESLKIHAAGALDIRISNGNEKILNYSSFSYSKNTIETVYDFENFPYALFYLQRKTSSKTNERNKILGELFEWRFIKDKSKPLIGVDGKELNVNITFRTRTYDYNEKYNFDDKDESNDKNNNEYNYVAGYQELFNSKITLQHRKKRNFINLKSSPKDQYEFVSYDNDSKSFVRLQFSMVEKKSDSLKSYSYFYYLTRVRIFFPHLGTPQKHQF